MWRWLWHKWNHAFCITFYRSSQSFKVHCIPPNSLNLVWLWPLPSTLLSCSCVCSHAISRDKQLLLVDILCNLLSKVKQPQSSSRALHADSLFINWGRSWMLTRLFLRLVISRVYRGAVNIKHDHVICNKEERWQYARTTKSMKTLQSIFKYFIEVV